MPQDRSEYTQAPVRRTRRKKTKMEIFQEAYLPIIMLAGAILLVILVIVGCFKLSAIIKANKAEKEAAAAAQAEQAAQASAAVQRGLALLPEAEALAVQYDYDAAISLLESFDGNAADVPGMTEALEKYRAEKTALVLWEDPTAISHISFQALIAKPGLAFASSRGNTYQSNNITLEEFSAILEQLYANGYVLVSLSDVAPAVAGQDGSGYQPGEIYLPLGKKPLIISQLPVNYGFPTGHGFASRLVVGPDGKPTCQYVNSAGTVETGAFDLVPLLDAFLEQHPDFSYHGAKAILAFTGSEGVLGYQTQPDALSQLGQEAYDQEVASAKAVAQALIADGYTLACFTYDGVLYGNVKTSEIEADLADWQAYVEPIVGKTSVLFYYSGSDIADNETYSGSRYRAMYDAGFRYFCGIDNSVTAWAQITNDYVRQNRRTINGNRLTQDAAAVADLFDAKAVLSPDRK